MQNSSSRHQTSTLPVPRDRRGGPRSISGQRERRGHYNPAERLGHCPSFHPEGSPPSGGTPSPGTRASRRGTRPPHRAADARRSLPRSLNLPGDSDAGAPREPSRRVPEPAPPQPRAPGSLREQRSPLNPGTASRSGEVSELRSSGSRGYLPGLPDSAWFPSSRSRRPRMIGSGSGGDLTRPEAMRGADGARGLGGPGRGGDEGGPCGARNRQTGVRALPGHYNNGGPIKARAPGVARRAPRRRARARCRQPRAWRERAAGGPPRAHTASPASFGGSGLLGCCREAGWDLERERDVIGGGEAEESR